MEEVFDKQTELRNCILAMASRVIVDEEMPEIVAGLTQVYSDNYRHSYSFLFRVITEVLDEEDETHSLDYLADSIVALQNYICAHNGTIDDRIKGCLFKLCDHLNLEIARANFYSYGSAYNEQLKSDYISLTKEAQDANEQIELVKEESKSQKIEIVAVLGVFSAIVITFSGGLNYLGSAFAALTSVPLLYSLLSILVCGLVLANIIFVLLYMIASIAQGSIRPRGRFVTGQSGNLYRCHYLPFERKIIGTKGVIYMIVVNLIIITMIIIVVLCLLRGADFVPGIAFLE